MGREIVSITASAALSRHNSDDDERDDKLWDEFVAEVTEIAKRYKRRGIEISVGLFG